MNEEIDNDPDFEENSIDPFNSDESEIYDSDHENDPPLDRIVAHIQSDQNMMAPQMKNSH